MTSGEWFRVTFFKRPSRLDATCATEGSVLTKFVYWSMIGQVRDPSLSSHFQMLTDDQCKLCTTQTLFCWWGPSQSSTYTWHDCESLALFWLRFIISVFPGLGLSCYCMENLEAFSLLSSHSCTRHFHIWWRMMAEQALAIFFGSWALC